MSLWGCQDCLAITGGSVGTPYCANCGSFNVKHVTIGPIPVPDIPGPVVQLCWKQAPNMVRCDRRLGHPGKHSWEAS